MNKIFFTERSGRMSQFAGIERMLLTEGKAAGVEAAQLWNYAGLSLQVLPGRGMDIGRVTLKGIPYSYLAKPGITAPAYYESGGMNWVRSFFGGMLTTCGLSNVGGPQEYADPVLGSVLLGLHGRISNTAAENVSSASGWKEDDYFVSISGEVRESCLHAENFVLRRKVTLFLKSKTIFIEDEIENESFLDLPLMLLYHINVGYPVLDEKSVFVRSKAETKPAGNFTGEKWSETGKPQDGYEERLYFHTPEKNMPAFAAVINPAAELGFAVKFDAAQLPFLTEWKMLKRSEYVLGIEPGNCFPTGRKENEENGRLEILPAGEKKHVSLQLCLLDQKEELDVLLSEGITR